MSTLTLRLAFWDRATPRGISRALLSAAIMAAAYYIGCLIGFALRFPSSGISFLWPPTAVMTSALLIAPPRSWPLLLASAFAAHAVAHAQNGVPVAAWPVQFVGNGVQAVLAAWVVRRLSTRPGEPPFSDFRSVAVFIAGASLLAPAIASLIPAYMYVSLGWAADFSHAWRARAVSNAIASLTLVPPIVAACSSLWPRPVAVPLRRAAEFTLLLVGIFGAGLFAAQLERPDAAGLSLGLYAPVPFLLWASVRFGAAGLSCALLTTTLPMVTSVLQGQPVGEAAAADTVTAVQLFITVMAVPLMLMAGLLDENRSERRTLMEIEQQNGAILRAIPDLMFLQTRDGTYLKHYARNAAELLVPPEVFLGKNMREVLPAELAEMFAKEFSAATYDEPRFLEYALEMHGGRRHYEARFIALDQERILSIVRDITARTRSEAALRESQQRYALATAAGGLGVWDANLVTGALYVGPELKASLGYADIDIPNEASAWTQLVHPEDLADLKARSRAHVAGLSGGFEAEHRVLHRDGSVRWFVTRGEITERVQGQPVRMTGTYTDITQRRKTERALKQANAALTRMARVTALGELTASIAHEVNQPLCAIVANANACLRWLDTAAPDADLRGALNDVVQDSHRASEIIRRTRELFTNRPVRSSALDLNASIRSVLELARGRLQRAAVVVDVELDRALPPVAADELQIQQVVLNLVLNAVDAMRGIKERPRFMEVRSRRGRGVAIVTIRDHGKGLGRTDLDRIFEPFYTTKANGLGIGLAVSRTIVKAHHGSLWAIANAGGGATFRFTLPEWKEPHD